MPNQETHNQSEVQNDAIAAPLDAAAAHKADVKMMTRYGVLLLCLIAALGFFFVYGYLSEMQPVKAEPAAVAAAKPDPFENVAIAGKAAIVVDLTTGASLYEKNADSQLPLASLTKVPLTIAVAEAMPDRNQLVTIPYDTLWNSNAQQLHKGQVLKLQDLIDYTLIASSNEGADNLAAVAEKAVSQKYPDAPAGGATLWRMNNLVTQLGLSHTYFLNDNGLDESTTQSGAYGSPRDVSKIFAYAAENFPDTFAGTAKNGELVYTEDGDAASVTNTNEALGDIPGLIMGKTGYTDLAGGNLAVVFDVGLAHPVVAVVMGSTKEARFSDMKILVKAAREAVMQQ